MPAAVNLTLVLDRTTTIRASVHDVELTLVISIVLVVLVVFVFLRDVRATLIPGVAVPVSLIGTFGVMYLFGYSLDNLSLMALTIATGFVVDDAIVVVENITRHLEQGMPRSRPRCGRARDRIHRAVDEHFAGGGVHPDPVDGRHRRAGCFASLRSCSRSRSLVSLVVSLTTTPMMCARLLSPHDGRPPGRLYRASERVFDWLRRRLRATLGWALRHPRIMLRRHPGDGRAQRLSVHGRPQGLLPPAGHRPAHRLHRGRAGHLVPGHAGEGSTSWRRSCRPILR